MMLRAWRVMISMPRNDKSKEIQLRISRLVMNLFMVFIFWVLNAFVPPTLEGVYLPGIHYPAGQVFWFITLLIMIMFLARVLSDALALGNFLTEIVIRRIGIKEALSPKRALRDLIYIIVTVLVAAAISPFIKSVESHISMISTAVTYIALALIIVLIYDISRITYNLIEGKAEILAKKISKLISEEKTGRSDG